MCDDMTAGHNNCFEMTRELYIYGPEFQFAFLRFSLDIPNRCGNCCIILTTRFSQHVSDQCNVVGCITYLIAVNIVNRLYRKCKAISIAIEFNTIRFQKGNNACL